MKQTTFGHPEGPDRQDVSEQRRGRWQCRDFTQGDPSDDAGPSTSTANANSNRPQDTNVDHSSRGLLLPSVSTGGAPSRQNEATERSLLLQQQQGRNDGASTSSAGQRQQQAPAKDSNSNASPRRLRSRTTKTILGHSSDSGGEIAEANHGSPEASDSNSNIDVRGVVMLVVAAVMVPYLLSCWIFSPGDWTWLYSLWSLLLQTILMLCTSLVILLVAQGQLTSYRIRQWIASVFQLEMKDDHRDGSGTKPPITAAPTTSVEAAAPATEVETPPAPPPQAAAAAATAGDGDNENTPTSTSLLAPRPSLLRCDTAEQHTQTLQIPDTVSYDERAGTTSGVGLENGNDAQAPKDVEAPKRGAPKEEPKKVKADALMFNMPNIDATTKSPPVPKVEKPKAEKQETTIPKLTVTMKRHTTADVPKVETQATDMQKEDAPKAESEVNTEMYNQGQQQDPPNEQKPAGSRKMTRRKVMKDMYRKFLLIRRKYKYELLGLKTRDREAGLVLSRVQLSLPVLEREKQSLLAELEAIHKQYEEEKRRNHDLMTRLNRLNHHFLRIGAGTAQANSGAASSPRLSLQAQDFPPIVPSTTDGLGTGSRTLLGLTPPALLHHPQHPSPQQLHPQQPQPPVYQHPNHQHRYHHQDPHRNPWGKSLAPATTAGGGGTNGGVGLAEDARADNTNGILGLRPNALLRPPNPGLPN